MKKSRTVRFSIGLTIIAISVLLWVLLLFNPGNIMTMEHCHVSMAGVSEASFTMLMDMNPWSDMMLGWILMVFAMMLPKLIFPIQYIFERSFKRYQISSSLLFVLGYAAVWTIMGVVMNAFIVGANLVFPQSFIPAIAIATIAVVWQFSPIKQRFLNRGHDHKALAAFGWKAHRDAFMFGVDHGWWCVCSGWALMLFPMLMPQGHNAAMLVVTVIMVSEHMEHPQVPKWRFDFRLKLVKAAIAQTRLKLKF